MEPMQTNNTANLEIAFDWLKTAVNECLKIRFGQSEGFELVP